MAQPSLSREVALETVERVEEKLREGFRPIGMGGAGQGAVAVAADAWGISRGTMNGRIAAAKLHYGLEPDDTLYRPRQYQHHSPPVSVKRRAARMASADSSRLHEVRR